MSFEVVASSRVEERRTTSWRLVTNIGLQMGGTGLALALVGILSMFNNRPIIVGLVTLGYATLGILFLVAGCSSVKTSVRRSHDELSPGRGRDDRRNDGRSACLRHEPREFPVHLLIPR